MGINFIIRVYDAMGINFIIRVYDAMGINFIIRVYDAMGINLLFATMELLSLITSLPDNDIPDKKIPAPLYHLL